MSAKYGSISKIDKFGYQVRFKHPMDRTININKLFKTIEEAEAYLNEVNYNFYEKHTFLLPKGISINRGFKKFVFSVYIKNKMVYVIQDKDLAKVEEEKLKFINKLI